MSYLNYAYKIVEGQTLSGLDGDVEFTTNPLDFRFGNGAQMRIGRLIGLGLYHNAATDTSVKLDYIFGITDETYEPNLSDIYEVAGAHDALLDNTDLAPGQLHVVPAPTLLMPFMKFVITVRNGSVPGVYQLWAYCSERYQG